MRWLLLANLVLPTLAMAGYGGMGGPSEGGDGGSGSGGSFLLWSIFVGVVAGYLYSLHYNNTHDEEIAADGCMIIGGFAGPFVCGFLWIIFY